MDINKFKDEVHANAVAHGWWGKEYTDAAAIALIHAEISEALEEWRAGRPMMWRKCALVSTPCGEPCARFFPNKDCKYRESKPEGVAVELIDVVLRILDAAAAWGVTLEEWPFAPANRLDKFLVKIIRNLTVPELVCDLHRYVIDICNVRERKADADELAGEMGFPLAIITIWLRARDLDPEALMLEKHRYNVTRPYKHGNKRI